MSASSPATRRPSWAPRGELVHLVWVANLLWQPVFDPTASWGDWTVVGVSAAVMVVLFVASYHPVARVRRGALYGTTALGVVTMVNVGAAVFFVYAAAMAMRDRSRRPMPWLVGLTLAIAVLSVVTLVPWPYSLFGVLPCVVLVWVIGLQTRADMTRHAEAERLRIDNVRIEQLATAAERERIARDLHDLLGQQLTGVVVRSQLIQSLAASAPEQAGEEARLLESEARDLLDQVRRTVGGLSEVSLADEVEGARRSLGAAGIEATFEVPTGQGPNPLVERSLALALRESVTNLIRHSGASRCRVVLASGDGVWRLEVADDGVGGDQAEGNGLRGMRERVGAIGGSVERSGDRGTRVVVTVPA